MNKHITELTIYDEFELTGTWWIPEYEHRIGGSIKYSSDGITLKLLDNPKDPGNDPSFMDNHYPILHGVTEDGELITLCDGVLDSCSTSSVITLVLRFNQLIVGKHFSSKEDIKFHSVSVNYSSLEEWLQEHPFSRIPTTIDGQTTISYTSPSTFKVYIQEKSTSIESSYKLTTSRDLYKSHTFKQQASLKITPDMLMGLDWYIDIIHELQDFLTVMTNRAIYPKKIVATGHLSNETYDPTGREKFSILILPQKMFEEQRISEYKLHIPYKKIQNNLESILNNWFADSSYSSRKIYLRNFYEKAIDRESKFLNYTKALESFHRDTNTVSGQFVSDEVYLPIKEQMLNAIQQGSIDAQTFNDFKTKLTSVLNYAHHFGFERRIRDMFKDLPPRIKDMIFSRKLPEIKTFARNVTITRDYYTHYGDRPIFYFKETDFFFVNERLHVILYYYFCKNLGINDDIICSAIKEDISLEYQLSVILE
ncbi:HEPN domain-containing protein [Bacillus cereus group sp. MYBK104-1]|uniref:ApeA N-terminal domain 1-containing protein n=1 Tax=unclassified Bacillus cereus group TaxID=2750818 RepID=UPI003F7B16BE